MGVRVLKLFDQVLKIDDQLQCAQIGVCIADWTADHNQSAAVLAAADSDGIAGIGASIMGSCQAALQLLFQEFIGSDGADRHKAAFRVNQAGIRDDGAGVLDEILQQRPNLRGFHPLAAQVAATGDLDGISHVGQRGKNVFLALGDILGQGAGHGVLQQAFIALQRLAIHGHHFGGIEVQRHNTDSNQYAENQVENRDSGWKWQSH